ncbi:MAG: flagellar basal body-associated FliL family protein [Parvularculaceae bacterium]|nr:flagellar basal body-associated FliL family protein [Parvularculaceae bacterium]
MGNASGTIDADPATAPGRLRVRTPGKHIILFSLAVTFMIAISTLVLSRSSVDLSHRPFAVADQKPIEETLIVDLSPDAQGRLRLLQAVVEIEAGDAAARRMIDEKRSVIRERLSFFLRELSPEDLDGTQAQEQLKTEMLRRVNLSLAAPGAEAVVIRSIVIQ